MVGLGLERGYFKFGGFFAGSRLQENDDLRISALDSFKHIQLSSYPVVFS